MNNVSYRLEKCFAAVFPRLSPEQIRTARMDSVAMWDSTSSVTLIAVIGEEFGIPLDLDHIEEFSSFEGIHTYLVKQIGNG